jgi:hypothetical protein
MNENIINKIIKKIHLRLLTFFTFLFLIIFFVFVALIDGFTISHLKLGNITLEKVYLKWDNRLHIKASLVDLSDIKSDNEPITLKPLQQLPYYIKHAEQWISSIDIQTIRYKKTSLSLHYLKNQPGTISVHNSNTNLFGKFTLTSKSLTAELISSTNDSAQITVNISLDIMKQLFHLNSTLKLPNTPKITLYSLGDQKRLYLKVTADESFTRIDEIVDFIGLDPIVRPWVIEYAAFKTAELQNCEGNFLYDNPDELVKSLNIHAIANQAEYTFAQGIEPIKAKKVDLYFQNGQLHIIPHNGSFYTLPTEKSRLYIDFTTPHTMLNAHILTSHAQLNTDILFLLNHYKIKVPIRQKTGFTNVDLYLNIDLHDLETTAQGVFIPTSSEIQLEDFNFNSLGGRVTLKGPNVVFDEFDVSYDTNTRGKLKGNFDATKEMGKIHIFPYTCAPTANPNQISLRKSSLMPHIIYHINTHQDRIEMTPSTWNFYGKILNIESFILPFDFKEKHLIIPKLKFNIDKNTTGSISGNLSSKKWRFDILLDKVNLNGLVLQKKPFAFRIAPAQNSITLSSATESFWELNDQPIILSPFTLTHHTNMLIFNDINIAVEKQLIASVSGKFSWKSQQGSLILKDMSALNPKISHYIDMNRVQTLSIDASKDDPIFHSKTLGLDITPIEQGWKIEVKDIALLSNNSPLLSYYQLDRGNITLFYSPANNRISFNGMIEYPYHLMMVNGKSLSTYRFSGSHIDGKTYIRVNDRINITRNKSIYIRANNMGVNSHELLRWLSSSQKTKESNTLSNESEPISLNATNINLYLMENRNILADNLTATVSKGNLDARLTHAQGSADLTMKEGIFYVQGANFGDRFMDNLFAFSDFRGGNLSFTVEGKTDQFEGIVRINNTILKEYIVLNNILSFVNTIPSLATFSLPNYSTKGLYVKDTYSHFVYENQQFTMDNYTLNSEELKIAGNARINMVNDTISGTLTLKSDLGSVLGKVPMVGYILMGNDGSISTTVNLKGKLSDPIVETAIAKEIVTAPFNILKRTVTYPFLWMMDDQKKK